MDSLIYYLLVKMYGDDDIDLEKTKINLCNRFQLLRLLKDEGMPEIQAKYLICKRKSQKSTDKYLNYWKYIVILSVMR